MKVRCVVCGSEVDVSSEKEVKLSGGWVEGVMPVEIGYVDIGSKDGRSVILVGLDNPAGQKCLLSLEVQALKDPYREIGQLISRVDAVRNN